MRENVCPFNSTLQDITDNAKMFGKVDEEIDKRQMDKDLDTIVDCTKKWQMKLNTDIVRCQYIGMPDTLHPDPIRYRYSNIGPNSIPIR